MTENTSSWTTNRDYIDQMIIPALAEHVDDYDINGIWEQLLEDEILGYDAALQAFIEIDPETATDQFWKIVEQHVRN